MATTSIAHDPNDPSSRKYQTLPLCQVTAPEEKRKIIGDTFMKVANEIVQELNLKPEEVYLGQGTLRPDLIESASELASNKADAIKTHHNDTHLVRELRKQVSSLNSGPTPCHSHCGFPRFSCLCSRQI